MRSFERERLIGYRYKKDVHERIKNMKNNAMYEWKKFIVVNAKYRKPEISSICITVIAKQ